MFSSWTDWLLGLFSDDAPTKDDTPSGTVSAAIAPGYDRWPGARPEVDGLPAGTILDVPGLATWSNVDRRAVLDAARELRCPVDSLVSVWSSESGLNPRAAFGIRHFNDGRVMRDSNDRPMLTQDNQARVTAGKEPFYAVGILQLTKAANLEGFTTNDALLRVLEMTAAEQIGRVAIPLYRKMRVEGVTPGKLYMQNFLPEHSGKPPDYVLGDKNASGRLVSIYNMNRGFDTAGKGTITVDDVYAAVGRVVKKAGFRRMTANGKVLAPDGAPAPAKPPAAKDTTIYDTPAAKPATKPAYGSKGPSAKPWERFGPAIYDLTPVKLGAHTLLVTRIPVNALVNGIVVFPPFSLIDAREYIELGDDKLSLATADVLDAMHAQGWYHAYIASDRPESENPYKPPASGFYNIAGDMNTDAVVIELGRRWQLAMKAGGYTADMGPIVNTGKPCIIDQAGIDAPGQCVLRGFYEKGPPRQTPPKSPVNQRTVAHPKKYKDLSTNGVFVQRRTVEGADYHDLIAKGAFGSAPLDVATFWRAAGL